MTSYHKMFKLCKVYKGPEVLKICPTWEKNNRGELYKIAKKCKKVYQSSILCKPHAPMKKTATNAIEPLPLKNCNLIVNVAPKPPKSPSRSIPEQRVKYVVQCVKFEEHQGHDYEGHDGSKIFADASSEDGSEAQSPKEATDEDTPIVEPPISAEMQYIILGTTSDERHFMW